MGRLLVSVRGPIEAVAAACGGAHIMDVEYPASALGTPYPLNIKAVRKRLDEEGWAKVPISTNIGEEQPRRSTACQAAVGVGLAGADYVKCGVAGLDLLSAKYLIRNIVRSVREWLPEKKVYPAVFPEEEFAHLLDPLQASVQLAHETDSAGVLIDTYRKGIGRGLLDYYRMNQLTELVRCLHDDGREAWLAGSITEEDLPSLWETGVDVVCVRGAACESRRGEGRFGDVRSDIVARLVATIPRI